MSGHTMSIELPKQFEARIASIADRELEVRGQKREDLRAYCENRVLDDHGPKLVP
jgi:hypothetical protein